MGLLRFLRHAPAPLETTRVPDGWIEQAIWRSWEPPRNFVRGEQSYQQAIRQIDGCGPPREGGYLVPVVVLLEREPSNPYDSNAVRATVGEHHVGYLMKELAADSARRLKKGERVSVAGIVRGGYPQRAALGVHIWPDRVVAGSCVVLTQGTAHESPNWPPSADEGDPTSGRRAGPRA